MKRSALHRTHTDAGATFGEHFGWELPARYSSARREYAAAREGAALIDRSCVGRLKMTGCDALDLVNRLSTNEIRDFPTGTCVTSVLTNSKGKVVDLLTLHYRSGYCLLLTSPQNRQKVVSWLDQFTFGEEIELKDMTDSRSMLTLIGPCARVVLELAAGRDLTALRPGWEVSARVGDSELFISQDGAAWGESYSITVGFDEAPTVWRALLENGHGLGLEPMGTEAYEVLRVGAGVPAYGRELSEDVNPLEAGLRSHISFSKGCYVGQEVVARLDTYNKVKRHLVKLRFNGISAPEPGASLMVDGKEVGTLTSVALVPGDGRAVALGYVRKAHARPGVKVTASCDGGNSAGEVVALAGE